MTTFHVLSFGCQMNAHDSDWLQKTLTQHGFTPVENPDTADFVLINTCSVREKPVQKLYELINRLDARKNSPRLGIGGCVAVQLADRLFKRSPNVKLLFNTDSMPLVPAALNGLSLDPDRTVNLITFSPEYAGRQTARPGPEEVAGFVTIMQGCNNYCSYCIVPYVRGPQRSRPRAEILDECRYLAEAGIKEITLLGQNVNSWGFDQAGQIQDRSLFAELIRDVAEIEGLSRIRFITSHPKDLSPELIEAFAEQPKLCPHLHLPLQSGSDEILKAMGRRYNMDRYYSLVRDLRQARPDISLTTDFIIGFPGETETDFEKTMQALQEIRFHASFSFKYNDRPGVKSTRLPFKVPEEIKADRLARLQELQESFTSASLKGMVGQTVEVLFERTSRRQDHDGTAWQGRDPHNYVVNITLPDDSRLAGQTRPVRIIEAKRHTLNGEPV